MRDEVFINNERERFFLAVEVGVEVSVSESMLLISLWENSSEVGMGIPDKDSSLAWRWSGFEDSVGEHGSLSLTRNIA